MAIVSFLISSSALTLEAFSLSLAIGPLVCSYRDLKAAPDACYHKLCASLEFLLISLFLNRLNNRGYSLLLSLKQLSAHVFLGHIYTLVEQSRKMYAALFLA